MVDLRSAQMMYNALFVVAQLQFSFPRILFSSKTHISLSFQRIPQEKQIVRAPCLSLCTPARTLLPLLLFRRYSLASSTNYNGQFHPPIQHPLLGQRVFHPLPRPDNLRR
jgi:hypothetical protein